MKRDAIRTTHGFTLVELLTVIVIVGVLTLAGTAVISMPLESARTREGRHFMQRIEDDVVAFMQSDPVFVEEEFRGFSGYRQSLEFYDINTLTFDITNGGPATGDTITISPKGTYDAMVITSTYDATTFEWEQTTSEP